MNVQTAVTVSKSHRLLLALFLLDSAGECQDLRPLSTYLVLPVENVNGLRYIKHK